MCASIFIPNLLIFIFYIIFPTGPSKEAESEMSEQEEEDANQYNGEVDDDSGTSESIFTHFSFIIQTLPDLVLVQRHLLFIYFCSKICFSTHHTCSCHILQNCRVQ